LAILPSICIARNTGLSRSKQDEAEQEGDTPAPAREIVLGHESVGGDDHADAEQEAARDAGMDEAGVETALPLRRMFGDVDRRAAIFAAQRQPLRHAQQDQQQGCGDPDRGIGRQQADARGRAAHQGDRHQERIFAAEPVAEHAEQDRAHRAHAEADAEGGERDQQRYRAVARREEILADDARERAVDEEVVPFEHRAER
jgi:hypothetical protein